MDSKYLGKKVVQPIEELDFFPAPDGIDSITPTSDEVASSCPLPDNQISTPLKSNTVPMNAALNPRV